VFKVFGVSLLSGALFGLPATARIVFGIYALTRRWGRVLAVGASVTSGLIIIPFGFTALAGSAASGSQCAASPRASARRASTSACPSVGGYSPGSCRSRGALPATSCSGSASLLSGCYADGAGARKRLLTGFVIGIVPYRRADSNRTPATRAGMVIDPVFKLRGAGVSHPAVVGTSTASAEGGALAQISWPFPAWRARMS